MGLIRLFLACVVVVDHLRVLVMKGNHISADHYIAYPELGVNAGYAVIYFYVISGFLISYSLTHNHEQDAAGVIDFYKARFIRIFSLYWPLLAMICLMLGGIKGSSFSAKFTGIFLFGADWFTCFGDYPRQDFSQFPLYLGQAWSIGAELTFYAFAPLLIRSVPAAICVLCLSLACRISFVSVYGFDNTWTYHFFPSTVMFFLLGHFSRLAWEAVRIDRRLGVALLALSVLVSLLGIHTQAWDNRNFYMAIFLFAMSLPAVFELTRKSRLMNRLGDLSYPVYLIHVAVIGVVFFVKPSLGDFLVRADRAVAAPSQYFGGLIVIPSTLLICIVIASVVLFAIEQPVAGLARKILKTRPRVANTTSTFGVHGLNLEKVV